MTSKIGILTRKRPEFELGLPMPKQLNLNKLSDGGKLKNQWLPTKSKTNF
jgi:hypothetical protein